MKFICYSRIKPFLHNNVDTGSLWGVFMRNLVFVAKQVVINLFGYLGKVSVLVLQSVELFIDNSRSTIVNNLNIENDLNIVPCDKEHFIKISQNPLVNVYNRQRVSCWVVYMKCISWQAMGLKEDATMTTGQRWMCIIVS